MHSGLASIGGPWSNHLHAAAAWCHLQGIPFSAYVVSWQPVQNAMINDLQQWGVDIHWLRKGHPEEALTAAETAKARGHYWIPMGGDGPPGTSGVMEFFSSINSVPWQEIWVPVGTGTTLLGIAAALAGTQVVGFCPGLGKKNFDQLVKKCSEANVQKPVRLINAYPPFGQTNTSIFGTMNEWHSQTGIPTDAVYTGKMVTYFLERLHETKPAAVTHFLLIHTGGLQGNRSLVDNLLKF